MQAVDDLLFSIPEVDEYMVLLTTSSTGADIGTVLAEEPHTPELFALFREQVVQPRRDLLTAAEIGRLVGIAVEIRVRT